MIIQWMAYAVFVTALIASAALAVEQAAAIWGGARRLVWATALVAAAAVPVALAMRHVPPQPLPVNAAIAETVSAPALGAPLTNVSLDIAEPPLLESLKRRATRDLRVVDAYATRAWAIASLFMLAVFVRSAIGLRRRRKHWNVIDLDGERVLVAPDVGPAVIGAVRPEVVVPHWALSLDHTSRGLMLRHEAEHIRSRDPQLLLGAALTLALFPWNAALWVMVRRLRLAIEMDCDRSRAARIACRPRDYGMLLLAVGALNRAPLHLAASLAERRPFLERRIKAMTNIRPTRPRLVTTALMVLAIAATTAATRTPHPAPLVHAATPTAPVAPGRARRQRRRLRRGQEDAQCAGARRDCGTRRSPVASDCASSRDCIA